MKYLSHYLKESQAQVMDAHGAFYAFNEKQFNESKKPDTEYVSMGGGLLCDKTHVKTFVPAMNNAIDTAVKADIKENGIDAIIQRELANHECQIVMSYADALPALEGYGVTEQQVADGYKIFFARCVEEDLF